MIKRAREIKNYDQSIWYLYYAIAAFPNVNYRYVIFPSKKMPGGFVPLDFDPKVIAEEIELGKNDTKRILESKMKSEIILKERLRNKHDIVYP